MDKKLHLEIKSQPDDTTCGPTCLHAVYTYSGDKISLNKVIGQVKQLKGGGTLAVLLGCHALRRGYRAKLYTFNLQVFDPTWFAPGAPAIEERLTTQMKVKRNPKVRTASKAYLDFLRLGGRICFEDLTSALIRGLLKRSIPIRDCRPLFSIGRPGKRRSERNWSMTTSRASRPATSSYCADTTCRTAPPWWPIPCCPIRSVPPRSTRFV